MPVNHPSIYTIPNDRKRVAVDFLVSLSIFKLLAVMVFTSQRVALNPRPVNLFCVCLGIGRKLNGISFVQSQSY